jgi:rieske iron-sulfur protein
MVRGDEGNPSADLCRPCADATGELAPCGDSPRSSVRRAFLQATLAAGALSLVPSAFARDDKPGAEEPPDPAAAAKAQDATSVPPQPGDRFALLAGDDNGDDNKERQIVKIDDLTVGGPQVQAYPIDPTTGVVRDGSRLNLVILIRLDPAVLNEETRARSADGVLAYSGVCTHQGCPVNMWADDLGAFVCSCHGSAFDPKDSAEVVAGPAPRPLPALPLKIENGVAIVASAFSGRVGSQI